MTPNQHYDTLCSNQVILLSAQIDKLKSDEETAEAKVAALKAQPSYPNIHQLTSLLVEALQVELNKLVKY